MLRCFSRNCVNGLETLWHANSVAAFPVPAQLMLRVQWFVAPAAREQVPLLQAFLRAQWIAQQAFCVWRDGLLTDLPAVAALLWHCQTAAQPGVQRCLFERRRAKKPSVHKRAPVPPGCWHFYPAAGNRAPRVKAAADCAQKLGKVVHPSRVHIGSRQVVVLCARQLPVSLPFCEDDLYFDVHRRRAWFKSRHVLVRLQLVQFGT